MKTTMCKCENTHTIIVCPQLSHDMITSQVNIEGVGEGWINFENMWHFDVFISPSSQSVDN